MRCPDARRGELRRRPGCVAGRKRLRKGNKAAISGAPVRYGRQRAGGRALLDEGGPIWACVGAPPRPRPVLALDGCNDGREGLRLVPGQAGRRAPFDGGRSRSEEHTSELQSRRDLVCRLLLEKKKKKKHIESCGETQ